jgi:hypothetical protein
VSAQPQPQSQPQQSMTLRYYDALEGLYRSLDEWKASELVSKDDVIDSVRESILNLMTHVIATPLIGTPYAYPGDLEGLDAWLDGGGASTTT